MIPGNQPSTKRVLEILSSLSTEGKQLSSEAFLRHAVEKITWTESSLQPLEFTGLHLYRPDLTPLTNLVSKHWEKTRQTKYGWDNQHQNHNIIFRLHVSMDWTSKMRQGMQILVRECWNQKGLNNTAVSEIMKLRASFPAVLTNFPSTTENKANAMWSWIKSPIGDAFAKAPWLASAVWKLLVGFDIHAKFLFIHITRRSWYRPNLLLAENRAALLRWMEISREMLLKWQKCLLSVGDRQSKT